MTLFYCCARHFWGGKWDSRRGVVVEVGGPSALFENLPRHRAKTRDIYCCGKLHAKHIQNPWHEAMEQADGADG